MRPINHLAEAIEKIKLVEGRYDVIRIVEPATKKALLIKEDGNISNGKICYHLWDGDTGCQNCLSHKAADENDLIFMSKKVKGKVYKITAVPFSIDDRSLVVELIKDVTNNVNITCGMPDTDSAMLNSEEHRLRLDVKDEFTNLFNRKYVEETLPAELLKALLNQEPLSLAIVSLDHLHQVIAEYGYLAGDRLAMEFADELKKYFAASRHWVARLSGERFMICLNICDKDIAGIITNKVTTDLSAKEVIATGKRIPLTCSSEVYAVCDGQSCIPLDELLEIIGWV